MDHVAIMDKKLNLLDMILSYEKTIESRWYSTRKAPWNRIKEGDTIYFKNAGEPVTVKAEAGKILQFENVDVKSVLDKHAKSLGVDNGRFQAVYERIKHKKYCILAFLKNPERIAPFNINKKGYGISDAWLCVDDINKIRK